MREKERNCERKKEPTNQQEKEEGSKGCKSKQLRNAIDTQWRNEQHNGGTVGTQHCKELSDTEKARKRVIEEE